MPTLLGVLQLKLEMRQSTVSVYAEAEEERSFHCICAQVSTCKLQPCLMKNPVSLFVVPVLLTSNFYLNTALPIKGSRKNHTTLTYKKMQPTNDNMLQNSGRQSSAS